MSGFTETDIRLVQEAAADAVREARRRGPDVAAFTGLVTDVEGPVAYIAMDAGGVEGQDPPGVITATRINGSIRAGCRVTVLFLDEGGVLAVGPIPEPPAPAANPTIIFTASHSVSGSGVPVNANLTVGSEHGDPVRWEIQDRTVMLPEGGLVRASFSVWFPTNTSGVRLAMVMAGSEFVCGGQSDGMGVYSSPLSGSMPVLLPPGGTLELQMIQNSGSSLSVQSRLVVELMGDVPVPADNGG